VQLHNFPKMATEPNQKPIHSVIIDTGPLIHNTVSISTIIASAEELYTTPAIISEIRDAATRSRVETTLKPFLNIRSPAPASLEAVSAFAKKTGDFNLLSRQDLGILALAYEVHCEKHGGPWGLRNAPNGPLSKRPGEVEKLNEGNEQKQKKKRERKQRMKKAAGTVEAGGEEPVSSDDGWTQVGTRTAGSRFKKTAPLTSQAPQPEVQATEKPAELEADTQEKPTKQERQSIEQEGVTQEKQLIEPVTVASEYSVDQEIESQKQLGDEGISEPVPSIEQQLSPEPVVNDQEPALAATTVEDSFSALQVTESTQQPTPPTSDDDSDGGDWITPDNLSKHQAEDGGAQPLTAQQTQTPVATMTTDFAMQNVLLQMNLNLLSTNMQRIRKLRTSALRCHACFLVTKEMEKQFCPRCGGPSLTRVSCSTNANGEFKIHLSKNFQHNTRGNRYSIPKPIAGTSNGKLAGKGGGKGGWGRDLVLAEDQKEFTKQIVEGKRMQTRDLMDEDYLPGILTGDRNRAGGRPKVGAGRNINSRKRF
jgi:RNA-binding protein NOB1